jgi:hypothetical protein
MSAYVEYQPDLLTVESTAMVSPTLGSFILDVSILDGPLEAGWAPLAASGVSVAKEYTAADTAERTLLVGPDTAEFHLSWWRSEAEAAGNDGSRLGVFVLDTDVLDGTERLPLAVTDRVRISYDGHPILAGTVESTEVQYTADAQAPTGARQRVDFSASVMGAYLVPLATTVTWASLPAEGARDRIERWMTIDGSSANNPMPAEPDPGSATLIDLLRLFCEAESVAVRLTGDSSAEVVELTSLPTGYTFADAAEMYWQTRRSTQAGAVALSLDAGDLAVNASASLITGDVRLVVSDWQIPGLLPVYGMTLLPVKRVSYTFTPTTFSGALEFHAPPVPIV